MGNTYYSQNELILKAKLENYKIRYNDVKIISNNYYNDNKEKESLIAKYKSTLSELDNKLKNNEDEISVSSSEQDLVSFIKKIDTMDKRYPKEEVGNKQALDIEQKNYQHDLGMQLKKINEFDNLSRNNNNLLENLENNFYKIQIQFNDINEKFQKKENFNNGLIEYKIKILDRLYNENQELLNKLENNKKISEQKKVEIENYIEIMKKTYEKIIEQKLSNEKDFSITMDEKSQEDKNGFTIDEDDKYDHLNILMKNWYEICYIYNDYDIHDITYELKAVDVPYLMKMKSGYFYFEPDSSIDLLVFEIDDQKITNYQYKNHSLFFDIELKNLESNRIHIKYRESPKKITEKEKAFRNIYREQEYGLSEILNEQNAKYILKNESDLEIINFDNEFLIHTKDNEYQWEGIIPVNGKKTMVKMSKKERIFHYNEILRIKTEDNSLIKYANIKIPFYYIEGNNTIIKNEYNLYPNGEINLDNNKKIYDVKFVNINTSIAEFHLKGILKNKCKADWVINMTNEEIDSLIPTDVKEKKEFFHKIAIDIINEYDNEHKYDLIKISSIAKIGKWIKKHILFDISFCDKHEMTAYETYINKRGVSEHITKLFNALIYSLGYPVLYALGYVIYNKNTFGNEDIHCWSIINIDKKGLRWLPFDVTFGIFSGKLPVTHVFKKIGYYGPRLLAEDKVYFKNIDADGL